MRLIEIFNQLDNNKLIRFAVIDNNKFNTFNLILVH